MSNEITVDSSIPQIWTEQILDGIRRQYIPTFIAATYQQACYWADQWGFRKNEWRYADSIEKLRGLRSVWQTFSPNKQVQAPLVWVCGTSTEFTDEAIKYALACGHEIVYAEDLH